ncbi:hypothetical protein [Streptomyces cyslabdanicus]|uniref:hypothetical protein n=1 Tax=Streptomyces cyslabdanicus TaxID=1470456 RepID=UPI004043D746
MPEQALGTGRCNALYDWATARSAVPRGTAAAAFTLTAPEGSQVLVRSLRIVKGRTIPVPEGRDVECVGAVDRTVSQGMGRWGQLSLDNPQALKLNRYVRPGGVIGGVVETRTVDCSCEWWIELEVMEGDSQRTVRIGNAGQPFTIAAPVPRIGTHAEDELQKWATPNIALARRGDTPTRASKGLSVSATRLLADDTQEMWMVTDQEVPTVRRFTANLDVPGRVCERVERALIAADGRPAGYDTYVIQLADGSPLVNTEELTDVSLRVERVERMGPEPTGYGCYPDDWALQMNREYERTSVQFLRDDSGLPVFATEPVNLYRETPNAVATDAFFFGIKAVGPRNVEYHFTIEVTVRNTSGRLTHYTLDDAGRPFVLAARPDGMSASQEKHTYHEIGHRIG